MVRRRKTCECHLLRLVAGFLFLFPFFFLFPFSCFSFLIKIAVCGLCVGCFFICCLVVLIPFYLSL